jgi:hypothetical protein
MNELSVRAAAVAFVVVTATPQLAEACSCFPSGPPCEAAWAASSIFTGTVRRIDTIAAAHGSGLIEDRLVTLDVGRGFVNATPGVLQVATSASGASCGYEFIVGRRYLVYAGPLGSSGVAVVTRCSRTRRLENAADDLRYLTRLPDPAAGARVFGRAAFWQRTAFDEEAIDYGPAQGLVVHVRGAGFHREAVTDRNGRYQIGGLPAGPVTVTIETPAGVDRRDLQREIELRDLRGCSQQDFTLTYSATATGRVLNASGGPVRDALVDAVDFELAGHRPLAYQHPARTDADGRFVFDSLPPGRYVFGMGLTRPRHGTQQPPTPAVYLPGTADAAAARIVDVAAGAEVDLGDLTLPH